MAALLGADKGEREVVSGYLQPVANEEGENI